MQKTLGGDRLGSGNKMKVDLRNFNRSTHDLSYVWRSTMSAGTLVPFMNEIAVPGDTVDIKLQCQILTHPTVGPLFGRFKVSLDTFMCPLRLYNALLHNNTLGIGLNMAQVKLPVLNLPAIVYTEGQDINTYQINPSSILSYLQISGVGYTETEQNREFNGTDLLAYWDVVKNYYTNKQEEQAAVIHTPIQTIVETVTEITLTVDGAPQELPQQPSGTQIQPVPGTTITITYTGTVPILSQILIPVQLLDGTQRNYNLEQVANGYTHTGTTFTGIIKPELNFTEFGAWRYTTYDELKNGVPQIYQFILENIDSMREAILAYHNRATAFDIITQNIEPYNLLTQRSDNNMSMQYTQEGLALKCYQSDLLNNWLRTEWIEGAGSISAVTAIDTSGGSFTIDTLIVQKKVYDMLNRIAVSGGTADDYYDAQYAETRYTRSESPMYYGGLIKELTFQEIISNTATGDQPLGTLAGRGQLTNKHKGGEITIKVDEPCIIMGIISLTPRIDYSQGNGWHTQLKTIADLHVPSLDEIGFQDLITEQMAWWNTQYDDTTNEWIQKSAGKQPAWINYMTNVNRIKGNFARVDDEMFMVLARRYEIDIFSGGNNIKDLTTYIDPTKYNYIFAETSLDAQNFWAQIGVDMQIRRKMSAKLMPNL